MTSYKTLSRLKEGDTLYVTDGFEPVRTIRVTEARRVPCIHGGRQDGENLLLVFDCGIRKTLMLSSWYAKTKRLGADHSSSVQLYPGTRDRAKRAYTSVEEARRRITDGYEEKLAPLRAKVEEYRSRIEFLTSQRDLILRDTFKDVATDPSATEDHNEK